jgi:hypothetical protein
MLEVVMAEVVGEVDAVHGRRPRPVIFLRYGVIRYLNIYYRLRRGGGLHRVNCFSTVGAVGPLILTA